MLATAAPPAAIARPARRWAIGPSSRMESAKRRAPSTRSRQRSKKLPAITVSPIAERPKMHGFRQQQPGIAGEINFDIAIKSRLVEQDRLLRQPCQGAAWGDVDLDVHRRVGAERTVNLLGRGRGDLSARRPRRPSKSRSKRSPPVIPPAVLMMAASIPAPALWGKRMRSEPASCTRARRLVFEAAFTVATMRPVARLAANTALPRCTFVAVTSSIGSHLRLPGRRPEPERQMAMARFSAASSRLSRSHA